MMNNKTKVLIDELIEDSHPIGVADLILMSLEDYSKKKKETLEGAMANWIVKRSEEDKHCKNEDFQNPEFIEFLNEEYEE